MIKTTERKLADPPKGVNLQAVDKTKKSPSKEGPDSERNQSAPQVK